MFFTLNSAIQEISQGKLYAHNHLWIQELFKEEQLLNHYKVFLRDFEIMT